MNTLKLALKSRTVWTLVFLLAFNVFQVVKQLIPAPYGLIVDTVLSTLAVYFHLNPSQAYVQGSNA